MMMVHLVAQQVVRYQEALLVEGQNLGQEEGPLRTDLNLGLLT